MPLRRLTVLLGKNSSGKTAFARLPLAIFTGMANRRNVGNPFPLSTRGISYGSAPLELVSDQAPHADFAVGFTSIDDAGQRFSMDAVIQLRQSLSENAASFVSSFTSNRLNRPIDFIGERGSQLRYSDPDVTGFQGLLPVFFPGGPERKAIDQLRDTAELSLDRLMHLTSVRAPIQAVYENRQAGLLTESTGAEVPYLLNDNPYLLRKVSTWYQESLDCWGLDIEKESSAFRIVLEGKSGRGHGLARAGQGFQQVLPVATYLCALNLEALSSKFYIVEEPELHLHPSIHPAIADLLVDAIDSTTYPQLLVETHSENLVLRLRRHVAEGRLKAEDIIILWFDEARSGSSVKVIEIRRDGTVTDWPQGVFAEDLQEVRAISQAARE